MSDKCLWGIILKTADIEKSIVGWRWRGFVVDLGRLLWFVWVTNGLGVDTVLILMSPGCLGKNRWTVDGSSLDNREIGRDWCGWCNMCVVDKTEKGDLTTCFGVSDASLADSANRKNRFSRNKSMFDVDARQRGACGPSRRLLIVKRLKFDYTKDWLRGYDMMYNENEVHGMAKCFLFFAWWCLLAPCTSDWLCLAGWWLNHPFEQY